MQRRLSWLLSNGSTQCPFLAWRRSGWRAHSTFVLRHIKLISILPRTSGCSNKGCWGRRPRGTVCSSWIWDAQMEEGNWDVVARQLQLKFPLQFLCFRNPKEPVPVGSSWGWTALPGFWIDQLSLIWQPADVLDRRSPTLATLKTCRDFSSQNSTRF